MRSIRLFFILTIFSFVFQQVNSQITIESLLSIPFPSDLVVSADKSTIAWVFNENGSRNIYVANGKDFENVKKITPYEGDDGMSLNNVTFSPDNQWIVFVRGNDNNRQKEAANPALLQTDTGRKIFAINKSGGDIRLVHDGHSPNISPSGELIALINKGQIWIASLADAQIEPIELFKVRGGQGQIRWSPDGNKIAFTSNRGDHSYIGIYDVTSKTVQFPNPTVDYDSDPVWSPDGNKIAFIRIPRKKDRLPFTPNREGHPWSIQLMDVQSSKMSEFWKADQGPGSAVYGSLPVVKNSLWWTNDNKIVFPWEKNGWIQLYAKDIDTKKITHLTPGNGIVENVTLANDGHTFYYSSNIKDINRRHIWSIKSDGSQNQMITSGEGIEWSPTPTSEGIVVFQSNHQRSAWPALVKNGKTSLIAKDLLPELDYTQLNKTEVIKVKATDGMESPAILFKPNDYDPNESYPAVIFLHGGSRRQMLEGFHYSGYYSNAHALQQYFASKGYIALSLNYRSGIGYGLEFREANGYGITGGSEVNDLFAAGEFLKDRSDVNAERIALWGGSYGGYLTAHGLARRSDLFAVGVDIHGVHNWNTELPTFAPQYDPIKHPEIAELALRSSPEYYVDGWKNPVLLIHGDDDRNVPFSESVYLTELLRDRGVYFEQLIFPDEVHGFLLHRNWLNAYLATFEFIDRYIGE